MIRTTVGLGNAHRMEPDRGRKGGGDVGGTRRRPGDRGKHALEVRTGVRHRHQWMQAEGLVGAKDIEPGYTGTMPDQRTRTDRGYRRPDGVIRHAQQDDRVTGAVVSASLRTGNGNPGRPQGGNDRGP